MKKNSVHTQTICKPVANHVTDPTLTIVAQIAIDVVVGAVVGVVVGVIVGVIVTFGCNEVSMHVSHRHIPGRIADISIGHEVAIFVDDYKFLSDADPKVR
jgi:hypothetical protein